MENINIYINKKTRQVNLSKSVIGNDGENLQENLVFFFDEFVDGTARLEIVKQNLAPSYIMLTKVDNTYQLPIKSIITKGGKINMQLVITEGTNNEDIPIFKSNEFYMIVNSSINAEIEEPEEYAEWIDIANTKLNEIDNLDIDATKSNHTATITITKKDGTEKSVQIMDGQTGATGASGRDGVDGITPTIGDNGNWYIGSTDTGKPSRGLQGETGASGQDGRDGYMQYTAGNNITIENGVISATGSSGEYQPIIDNDHKLSADLVDDNTTTNKFQYIGMLSELDNNGYLDLNLAKKGIYFADKTNGYNKFVSSIDGTTSQTRNLDFRIYLLLVDKKVSSLDLQSNNTYFAYALGYQNTWGQANYIKFYATSSGGIQEEHNAWAKDPYIYAMTSSNQQFYGKKQFHTIPEVYSYSAPTSNTQLVAKKYVDDSITNAITNALTQNY